MKRKFTLFSTLILLLANLVNFSVFSRDFQVVKRLDNPTLAIGLGPVSKTLNLSFESAVNGATLSITDVSGSKVWSNLIDAGATSASINVSSLASGSYFVIFTNGSSRSSKLFVKQ